MSIRLLLGLLKQWFCSLVCTSFKFTCLRLNSFCPMIKPKSWTEPSRGFCIVACVCNSICLLYLYICVFECMCFDSMQNEKEREREKVLKDCSRFCFKSHTKWSVISLSPVIYLSLSLSFYQHYVCKIVQRIIRSQTFWE